jgi:4-hydroxy-tetrahydrodipicolinate synthase
MEVDLSGLNPAHLLPVTDDGDIHEQGLEDHLSYLSGVDGVSGIVCNANAAEGPTLSPEERVRVLEIADDAVPAEMPIVAATLGGSTREVIADARRAREAGADAVLVREPFSGITDDDDVVREFYRRLDATLELPIVVFQHPEQNGSSYSPDVLGDLVELDSVVGVKAAAWEVSNFERDLYAMREVSGDVQVLIANDQYLLPCYVLSGIDGSLLGLGAVMPGEIVDLFAAVDDGDLALARQRYERLKPFLDAIYEPEVGRASTLKLKHASKLRGDLPTDRPHEPWLPLSDEQEARVERAMEKSGLLG